MYEAGDSLSGSSDPITVNLENLFTSFTVTGMIEMGLAGSKILTSCASRKFHNCGIFRLGNVRLDTMSRLHWNTAAWTQDVHGAKHDLSGHSRQDDGLNVVLEPMEIRTFLLGISRN